MKSVCLLTMVCLVLVAACPEAGAIETNITLTAGPAIPIGDFAATDNIIEQTAVAAYDALGGGARAGYGFGAELDFEVMPRLFIGGRFGYLRHDADADDIMEQGLTPTDVAAIDAVWSWTGFGIFVRRTLLESSHLGLYGRVDMGASRMKNASDVTIDVPSGGQVVSATDFDLGQQFYFGGSIGAEYWVSRNIALVTEVRLTYFLSDGASAAASLGSYTLTGTQRYNTQVLDVAVGIRIPLSRI